MSKTALIVAAGFAVALTAAPAFAQNGPSYEDRGYGGPLYVGPNFHEGGQYTHPIYGSGSYHNRSSSESRAPSSSESRVRQRSVSRSRDEGPANVAIQTRPIREPRFMSSRPRTGLTRVADAVLSPDAKKARPPSVGDTQRPVLVPTGVGRHSQRLGLGRGDETSACPRTPARKNGSVYCVLSVSGGDRVLPTAHATPSAPSKDGQTLAWSGP